MARLVSLSNLLGYAPLAQLVEHLTLNQGVDGSSPPWCTITRPVGQAVKTLASHASNTGSSPVRVTTLVGVDDGEEPPVPIPNTEVKLTCAENTWGAAPWEDR